MAHRTCPYWVGYLLINPLRRLLHNPRRILEPFVKPGMTVLDIGSAMGFFTLPMARMVGEAGKVIAVDVQPRMLEKLAKRAAAAGLARRILPHLAQSGRLGIEGMVSQLDFALAFAVMHEIENPQAVLNELAVLLRPGGSCLIAEPTKHVTAAEFEEMVAAARREGFALKEGPRIAACRSVLISK